MEGTLRVEEKRLFLAWQDPTNRIWRPVGILTLGQDGVFRFVYTEGARTSGDFVPFPGMEDLNSVYESDDLLPLFSNRLLSNSRPEYSSLLKWLDIEGAERSSIVVDMLAMTEGIRATDTFEVFKCPAKNPEGQYEVNFFSHGLRYVAKRGVERINSLGQGERLFLVLDDQNRYDQHAVALRTDDPVELVGYCPRYLSLDFRKLLEKNGPAEVVVTVKRVNTEAPLNLRLLCSLVSPWPDGFQPCSEESYKPLADYSRQVKDGTETQSHYSERKELRVTRQPRGHGLSINIGPGNRGTADLKATFPSGKSWNVRVKSSGNGTPASPSATATQEGFRTRS